MAARHRLPGLLEVAAPLTMVAEPLMWPFRRSILDSGTLAFDLASASGGRYVILCWGSRLERAQLKEKTGQAVAGLGHEELLGQSFGHLD